MYKNTLSLIFIFLQLSILLNAQQARLVKDFTLGENSTFTTDDERIITSYQDKVLFVIRGETNDFQLWISNGTEDSTYLLHQLEEDARIDDLLHVPESDLVFYSTRKTNANTLHAISKTTSDTINLYNSNDRINRLTYFQNNLYFKEDDNLVRLNPADKNVEIVYEFGSFRSLNAIGILNDQLILIGGESNGTELYVSDGTTEGTSPYFQLTSGSDFNGDAYMNQVGNQLLFFYERPEEPYILYATDGTAEGTLSLLELERTDFVDLVEERSIIVWEEKLFFRARALGSTPNKGELFVSDGTPDGSFKISLEEEGDIAKPADFTPFGDALYFRANFDLYKTDGTIEGTSKVIDPFDLGRGGSFGGFELTAYQDSLYFCAFRSEVGSDLWVSAGETSNTRSLDIVSGEEDADIEQLISTENNLFLIYRSAAFGKELFVLDSNIVSSTLSLSNQMISIYPNPFENELSISMEKGLMDGVMVSLFDVNGRLVFRKKSIQEPLKLEALPAGAYWLKIIADEDTFVKKVIKK
ncbi:MAG: T9SS type A sorting domain-containing protein [Bacteroidota bacterium]